MQSGVKKLTNASILRDHVQAIKQAFYKFANQHNKLVEEQHEKPQKSETKQPNEQVKSVTDLESEVEQLKKQLAERDALIVKLTNLRSNKQKKQHSGRKDSTNLRNV